MAHAADKIASTFHGSDAVMSSSCVIGHVTAVTHTAASALWENGARLRFSANDLNFSTVVHLNPAGLAQKNSAFSASFVGLKAISCCHRGKADMS